MIDTEALRKKIIDLAIKGKLTQQLPEDGDAEDLYAQIQKEKAVLINEGKIKKEKPLPNISDEEIPFGIPSNWKWVRLCDIARGIWAGGDKPDDFTKTIDKERMIPVVANGAKDDGILGYTSKATASKNSITVAGRGTIGFTVYRDYDYCPIVRLIVIEQSSFIEPKYLQMFLKLMPEASVGSSIPQLTVPMIKPKLVPIPPRDEQRRIVKLVEAVFVQIDTIDVIQQQYESDREILKEKIIDAGICGKLTEQLPEDGNAEDLYVQIQEEKAKLIKEGKIKRKKPLPEITDDEIPFEIPKNWKWVRFLDVVRNISSRGHQITTSELRKTGNYSAISQGTDFIDGYSNDEDKVIWDIPLVLFGDHTRNVKYIGFPFIVCADGTQLLQLIACDNEYFYYWTKSVANQMLSRGYARHFSLLKKRIIPLPPLREQYRIAARIDELFRIIAKEY